MDHEQFEHEHAEPEHHFPQYFPHENDTLHDFESFAVRAHELCRYLNKLSVFVFFGLPVLLLLLAHMASWDKSITLIIWIISMFALTFFIIMVSFLDSELRKYADNVMEKQLDNIAIIGPDSSLGKGIRSIIDEEKAKQPAAGEAEEASVASQHLGDSPK